MKKIVVLMIQFCMAAYTIAAQSHGEYKNGYVLKGADTIWCKVRFDPRHDHGQKAVQCLINNEEVTFYAGGTITGFGTEDDGTKYDYGTVDTEVAVRDRRIANLLFLKKLVAGRIDLYEYSYKTMTTKRTTVNGVEKPGSASTTTQNFTNHYIAKTDSSGLLTTPITLPAFRKKDLEKYLGDYPELFAREEKKYSLKELIAVIKEYNAWYAAGKRIDPVAGLY